MDISHISELPQYLLCHQETDFTILCIDKFSLGVCVLNHFSCVRLCVKTPWNAAYEAPLSMVFSRQKYWSGLPCPPPGDLPDPGSFILFFKNFIYFNWRLITYNIVLVLLYISMNPPQVYTCSPSWSPLPPPSPYHPSGSSQCTSPKHPVSCIEPGLAIRFIYDIKHVSMPFSQIIPPSPSPTESKSLFCTSASLLLSRIQGYRFHLLNL